MDRISLAVLILSGCIAVLGVFAEVRRRTTEKRKTQARLNKWFIKYSSEHSQQ